MPGFKLSLAIFVLIKIINFKGGGALKRAQVWYKVELEIFYSMLLQETHHLYVI
jgi:hypothetical protein